MQTKNALTQFVHDVTSNPAIVGTAGGATTSVGASTYFGVLEKGVGLAAALMGIVVTVALWRKLRLESREIKLRIQLLEAQRSENDSDDYRGG